jgi:hypothetical protein
VRSTCRPVVFTNIQGGSIFEFALEATNQGQLLEPFQKLVDWRIRSALQWTGMLLAGQGRRTCEKRISFECFPYVCPEPVLVKCSFLVQNIPKYAFFAPRCQGSRCRRQCRQVEQQPLYLLHFREPSLSAQAVTFPKLRASSSRTQQQQQQQQQQHTALDTYAIAGG